MSGSFWRFGNGYNEVSTINNLLDNGFVERTPKSQRRDSTTSSNDSTDPDNSSLGKFEDYTGNEEESFAPNLEILGDLLDEQEILEELASSNIKLIEYLRQREVLEKLIEYIITEEDDLVDDSQKNEKNDDDSNNNNNDNNDNEEDESKSESSDYKRRKSLNSNSDSDSDDVQNYDQPETIQEIHSRRAQVAAEILSADAWSLTDSFMDNHDLLSKLWSVLDKPCPLSMVLSTYFMKINEHLLDMKIDEMLNFLLHQNNLVDRFLKHIDNPPLMDFLLKVISTDKQDIPTGIIDLLKSQNLVSILISFLDPKVNASVQSAAGDFIKAFVTISANSNTDNSTIGPNELTRELVSEKIMNQLCELMLKGGTSLANGVGIIIEIIRKNNSDYDFVPVLFITIESHPPTSRDPIYLGHLIKVFSKNIPKFASLLKDTKLPPMDTPFGSIEPLGFERFKICELIAELLHCSNMGLLNDEKGEEIVRERDIERERVIALEKQQDDEEGEEGEGAQNEAGDEDSDHEASKVIKRLSISSTEQDNEEDKTTEKEEVKEKDVTTDDDKDSTPTENKPSLEIQSEPDSDADTTLEIQYDEHETQIRKNPVVGDQLKIALADNQVILVILNMFFCFPWNNFLHNVVFDIVQQILNGSMDIGYNKYLAIDLFGRGEINKLIIEGQQKCEDYEQTNGLRLGYMGHLTLIAEEVVKFTALYPPNTIHQIVYDAVSTPEWTVYVTETLVDTREKYNALLGGSVEDEGGDETTEDNITPGEVDDDYNTTGNNRSLDSHEEDDEEGDNNRGNNESDDVEGDQFSRYMSQQLTNDLPDKFGSSDEDEEDDDLVGWNNQQYSPHQMPVDDDDDYVDPNDDGQSYTKKDHPLYSKMLSPRDERPQFVDDEEDDDELSGDEGDENDEEKEEDYGLTRSKSQGELNWDDDEQDRLINVASYIKNNQ